MAGEERRAQQRPGRHHRRLLSRLADADGHPRSAPGDEGGGADVPDGRRLDRRRFLSQRRVPPDHVRVDLQHGRAQEERLQPALRLSRHVRGVSSAGSADAMARRYKAEQLQTWRKLVDNPAYNAFWRGQAVQDLLAQAAEGAGTRRPRPVRSGRQFRRHRRLSRARSEGPANDMVYLASARGTTASRKTRAPPSARCTGTQTPVSGSARKCCSRSGTSI